MAKSVTVKIGSDTTDFLNELKKAEKEINKTQKTANNLAKSLKFDYDENRAVQAQRQFQKAIQQTEQSAQKLRDRLKEMQEAGNTGGVDYSRLELELAKTEAKAADLKKKLEEVKNVSIEKLTKKFKDVGDKISGTGQKLSGLSLAAAGAIAGAAALGKQAAATGAEIDDMTQRFGISAETIQRWSYLSLQAGVDSTTFTRALIKARAAMSDLSAGTSNTAVQTLEKLGIAANQFGSDEEMFNGIIAALSKVEDKALQTAYANEIFGDKIATELLPYINAGADDLAKWNAEFDAMPSLTGEEAAALALLDDTFNRLNTTMQYAAAQLGLALAPIMERVVEFIENSFIPAIEKLSNWFQKLSPEMQNAILIMTTLAAVASPLLMMVGKLASSVGGLIQAFSTIGSAASGPLGWILLIISLLGIAYATNEKFRNSLNGLISTLMDALTPILKMLSELLAIFIEPMLNKIGKIVSVILLPSLKIMQPILEAITFVLDIIYSLLKPIFDLIDKIKEDIENSFVGKLIKRIGDFFNDPFGIDEDSYTNDNYKDIDKISSEIVSGKYESNVLTTSNIASNYTDSSYSSNDIFNITVSGSNLSADEIVEEVSKKIATLAQSRG